MKKITPTAAPKKRGRPPGNKDDLLVPQLVSITKPQKKRLKMCANQSKEVRDALEYYWERPA